MKTKLLTLALAMIFANTGIAQKEHNIWYFGSNAGLDFNSGSPVTLSNGMLATTEGSSSISDANGNLLFYTDGITVWDKTHNQMPNGFGLAGNSSSTQSALIVPYPGSNSLYYIFTTGGWFSNPDFCYSIVDITLNGGNGNVTSKNILIASGVTERLTAVKHANGSDIWVSIQLLSSTIMHTYLVTSAGVNTTPVASNVGAILSGLDAQGQMKFSPDGSMITYTASLLHFVDLFDFDPSSGIISNKKTLPVPSSRTYGLEFSQSGTYLYCTGQLNPPTIYQWDVSSNSEPVINATIDSIGTTISQEMDALQMGPDGKIYTAKYGSLYLGIINDPDMPGLSCNYVDSGIYLGGVNSTAGLPGFISSYFLPTGTNEFQVSNSNFLVFPNPANEWIEVSSEFHAGNEIQVTDVVGNLLFRKIILSPTSDFRLMTSDFSNGIYFLSVQTEKDFTTRKIVVQH